VFAFTPASCHAAVQHLRNGAPDVPVHLFSTAGPLPETAALCQKITVHRNSLILFLRAQRALWPFRVALSVGLWNRRSGRWPLKLAPFLVPPFRALFLNENGDFFPGTPSETGRHLARRLRDAAVHIGIRLRNAAQEIRDQGSGFASWLAAVALHALLAVVSGLLRILGYPNRTRFDSLHGNGSLEIPAHRGTGEGVAVFTQRGPGWNGAGLERFARSSSSRWILWTRSGVSAELAASAALLEAPNLFAVSRQSHMREWKPMMFATAPFRRVPPGAACQVLAPVSDAILVDREKLLALGVPRTPFALTAWMILFWKAAAAGLRSYSIGGAGQPAVENEFPAQESSFVLHFLRNRELRRLGPREPELGRGAISFLPALEVQEHSRPGRLKVLLVSPFLPYPLSHGGAVRIFNLCRALSGRVDFVLIAIREKGEAVEFVHLSEVFRRIYVVDIDEHASPDITLPAQVRGHQSGALRALIADVARSWQPDLLQVEYTHMAAFAAAAPGIPSILVEHDLTFDLYRQLAASKGTPEAGAEHGRWLEFERNWLAQYTAVWTVSAQDRATVLEVAGRSPSTTFAVPNGVDVRRFRPDSSPADPLSILYVGSFRHLPNLLGFEVLVRHVMPRVWGRFPQVRLQVVAGPNPERYRNQPSPDPRIEILGFVEDLRPLYAKANVVVVPLEVSAGTNIKVLEAMACGKAIVSTPVGCAGLGLQDGVEILIRDEWESFADAVSAILAGSDRLLGTRARSAAEDRFSWTAIAEAAYESYQSRAGAEQQRTTAAAGPVTFE
jgi:glycosyltransferase involved in cell wall biosynthesis